MRRFLASALFAAVAVPAVAAGPVHHFTNEGERYSYTAQRANDGSVVLNGTVDNSGDHFVLRVRGAQVSGNIGLSPVNFTISKQTLARLNDEIPAVQQADAAGTALAAN